MKKTSSQFGDRFNCLLLKHRHGIISPAERRELEELLSVSPYHEEILKLIDGTSEYGPGIARMYSYGMDEAWARLRAADRRKTRRRALARAGIAACFAAFMVATVVFLRPDAVETHGNEFVSEIKPGQKFVYIESSSGDMHLVRDTRQRQTAQIDKALVDVENGEMRIASVGDGSPAQTAAMMSIHVPSGCESMPTILHDGTRVWLNSSSSLRFPFIFDADRRVVALVGEAYFEVSRDGAKPFIVEVAGERIEVLGTSFNVKAYTDDRNIETTLLTGKVRVSAGHGEVTLEPGQQARLDRETGAVQVSDVVPEYSMLWIRGELCFMDQTLENVFKQFGRWYNVEFRVDESLKGIPYTGVLKRYDNFNTLADLMTQVGEFYFKEVNGIIMVLPKQSLK